MPDDLGIRPHAAPPGAAPSGGERAEQHNLPHVSVGFRVRAENGTGEKGRKRDLAGSRPLCPLPTAAQGCPLPSALYRLLFVIGPWADLWAPGGERGVSRQKEPCLAPLWLSLRELSAGS